MKGGVQGGGGQSVRQVVGDEAGGSQRDLKSTYILKCQVGILVFIQKAMNRPRRILNRVKTCSDLCVRKTFLVLEV